MKQNSYLTKYDAKTIAMVADIYFEDINKKKDSLSFYDAKEISFNGKMMFNYLQFDNSQLAYH